MAEELIPLREREEISEIHPVLYSDNLTMKHWQFVDNRRIGDNEQQPNFWKTPFAFGHSLISDSRNYKLVTHKRPTKSESVLDEDPKVQKAPTKLFDIVELPILDDPTDINFEKYAKSLKHILEKGKSLECDQFNFKSKLDFYNMIIYIPEITKTGAGLLTIPNTAIAILGKIITDLLTKNKAWIILDAKAKGPITNLVLESLERAKLDVNKQITDRIRNRLTFLGLFDKPLRQDINPEAQNPLQNKRYQLSDDGCRELGAMASSSISKVLQGCVVLRHDHTNGKLVKEHILYEMSRLLKIPGLKLEFVVEPGKRTCYEIRTEFIDPYHKETDNRIYNFYRKEPELYEMILQKADDYFYRNNSEFKGWNTMTTALFLRDQDRVVRALKKRDLGKGGVLDQNQIGRIIRYALFYGSREIVENIFNHMDIQKCLVNNREQNLTSVFKKSGTELILFQRLMFALTKDEEYVEKKIKEVKADFTASLEVVKFLQLAIEKLMGDGFLWNIPEVQQHDVLLDITHYEVYFAEYIMVWGALSQRYEVAELFLEYSGGHLQELLTQDRSFYRTQKGVYQIANALAISRLLYGVEQELRFDTAVSTGDRETLIKKAAYFEELAVGLLDNAIGKNEFTLNELFETRIPFWNHSTAIELASTAGEQLFFTHEGVQGHVRNVWNGIAKLQEQYEDTNTDQNINIKVQLKNSLRSPFTRKSIQFFYSYYISPSTTFYIHALVYFIFLVLYTVHVIITWSPNPINGFLTFDVIYFLYMIAYILDEAFQYRYLIEDKTKGKRVKHNQYIRILKAALFEYLSSGWNILDIAIAIGFITTMALRISVFVTFIGTNGGGNTNSLSAIARLVYGLFGVLLYMRFFQYVLVFRGLGPLIYTCYIAFKRMLKFLVIFVLVSLGFGIVEVTLTSTEESGWALLRILLFSPYYQIFGEFGLATIRQNSIVFTNTPRTDELSFWESTTCIAFFFLIILQLIANVLLLNLMIAYFTKIFNEISENADSIYLTQFLEVVEEYQRKSFFPPPFNLLVYLIRTFGICKKVCLDFFKEHDEEIEDEFQRDTHFNRAKVYPVYFGHHNENGFADEYWRNREKIRIKGSLQLKKKQKKVKYLTQKSQEQSLQRKYTV